MQKKHSPLSFNRIAEIAAKWWVSQMNDTQFKSNNVRTAGTAMTFSSSTRAVKFSREDLDGFEKIVYSCIVNGYPEKRRFVFWMDHSPASTELHDVLRLCEIDHYKASFCLPHKMIMTITENAIELLLDGHKEYLVQEGVETAYLHTQPTLSPDDELERLSCRDIAMKLRDLQKHLPSQPPYVYDFATLLAKKLDNGAEIVPRGFFMAVISLVYEIQKDPKILNICGMDQQSLIGGSFILARATANERFAREIYDLIAEEAPVSN